MRQFNIKGNIYYQILPACLIKGGMSMIIDAHVHIGHDIVFDETLTPEFVLEHANRYGIDLSIVQPLVPRPHIEETRLAHNQVHQLIQDYPDKFVGMASINPHFRPEAYESELKRCVKDLGFAGVKITPIGHAVHPSGSSAMIVYEMCRELKIPVMIHTGSGAPFAEPLAMLKAAQTFKDVTFIMAHAGTDSYFHQALYVARQCENVFMEPSWLNVISLGEAIQTLGPSRIMFSSDMPQNIPVELAKYKYLLEDRPDDMEQIMWKTASAVFNLKNRRN